MAKGDQLNIRLTPEFIARLEADAKRFGLGGKNTAAASIIETYYEHWCAMQEEMLEVREAHLNNLRQRVLPEKRLAG